MNNEPETWRAHQARVLTDLRKAAGKKRAHIVRETGLTYWQIQGLETGESEILARMIPQIAPSYGTTAQALSDALGVTAPAWNPQAELEDAGMPAAEITATLATIADKPLIDQRAVIAAKVANRKRAQPNEPRRSEPEARAM